MAKNVRDEITGFKGPLNSIGHAQRLMRTVAPGYNLKKVQNPDFLLDKFKWMAGVTRGIWIVRLRAANAVDHCVVVDGRKKEIIDGEEKKPMRLCQAALRACGSDDAINLYVAEVREIYKSSKGTQN